MNCLFLPLRHLAVLSIKVYQHTVAGLLPGGCRFVPSCSQYALQALQEKPFPCALWLIGRRLLRCHPFCAGGFDPLP